ncbi:hypothetical protein EVAR_94848_1 [Eumeta japonica]|uniref:Uncharacterized protein n=1 Tax=Eumeta variegata TaxID=151549 RepID=A0A4C1V940_EUMVA|nr:hypothetical protein EVAR_94848_1 [Eumeta japonica]
MLLSWNSIITLPNVAGRHVGEPTARNMPYGRYLKGSPRHTMSRHRHGSGPFNLPGSEMAGWSGGVLDPSEVLNYERTTARLWPLDRITSVLLEVYPVLSRHLAAFSFTPQDSLSDPTTVLSEHVVSSSDDDELVWRLLLPLMVLTTDQSAPARGRRAATKSTGVLYPISNSPYVRTLWISSKAGFSEIVCQEFRNNDPFVGRLAGVLEYLLRPVVSGSGCRSLKGKGQRLGLAANHFVDTVRAWRPVVLRTLTVLRAPTVSPCRTGRFSGGGVKAEGLRHGSHKLFRRFLVRSVNLSNAAESRTSLSPPAAASLQTCQCVCIFSSHQPCRPKITTEQKQEL